VIKREASYVRVPHSFLSECFDYTKEGVLLWKLRPKEHFKTLPAWKGWFTRCYNKPVGCIDLQGYYNFALHYNGKIQRLHVHRVIMSLYLGRDLERTEIVDHIDWDRTNNSLSNLRLVDHSVNAKNTSPRKNNTSGQKNIWWCKSKNKWQVSATRDKNKIHVGFYKNLCDAIAAQQKFYEEGI
jgi:hypothetical protein